VGTDRTIDAIGVVVPAHDESATIGQCLDALAAAAAHPQLGGISVEVVVVLDRCTDDTGDRALQSRRLRVRTTAVRHHNVGKSRRAGFGEILTRRGESARNLWLATTDADTTVPPDWFAHQLAWRAQGFDALAGTVQVMDWSGHSESRRASFLAHQAKLGAGNGHGHVHGANLSFTADAYLAVGGMPGWAVAEDHGLWARMRFAGLRTLAAGDLTVTTSARLDGRARGGFSTFMQALPDDGSQPDEAVNSMGG
jgi:glycosyltransferase involved in cell wall biosynthesis